MKIIFLLLLAATCSAVASVMEEWTIFKTKHGRTYPTLEEEHHRLGIYLSNKRLIEEHNKKFEQGLVSYKLNMNRFGDKSQAEYTAEMNGFNKTGYMSKRRPGTKFLSLRSLKLPQTVDWRDKGAVTNVKDQGRCGSCWAFSATGSLEGQIFRKYGELVSLSEQNLVDCADGNYQNLGCNGGLMDLAFHYVIDNKGIDTEDSYPYEAEQRECRFRKDKIGGTASSYVDIPSGDEYALKEAVAMVGPISVAMNAAPMTFAFYKSGVYNDLECDPEELNHGVLLVGYGNENGQDYWLIKNSWASRWGDGGYAKIRRGENLCGISTMASYPVV